MISQPGGPVITTCSQQQNSILSEVFKRLRGINFLVPSRSGRPSTLPLTPLRTPASLEGQGSQALPPLLCTSGPGGASQGRRAGAEGSVGEPDGRIWELPGDSRLCIFAGHSGARGCRPRRGLAEMGQRSPFRKASPRTRRPAPPRPALPGDATGEGLAGKRARQGSAGFAERAALAQRRPDTADSGSGQLLADAAPFGAAPGRKRFDSAL